MIISNTKFGILQWAIQGSTCDPQRVMLVLWPTELIARVFLMLANVRGLSKVCRMVPSARFS